MKIDGFIKNLSALVAALVVFFLAGGTYLSLKGFVFTPENGFVLVQPANAQNIGTAPNIQKAAFAYPSSPSLGSDNAKITIYEFSSFGCFHCAGFHNEMLPKIKADFIDKGLVRVVFVNFPLDKKSMQGAMIGKCLTDTAFFKFADLAFKNQRDWALSADATKLFRQYANINGLSNEKFDECLKDSKQAENILAVRQEAMEKLGINGTPSIVISTANSKELMQGVPGYEELKTKLENKLK